MIRRQNASESGNRPIYQPGGVGALLYLVGSGSDRGERPLRSIRLPDGDATFSIDAVNDVVLGAGPVIYFECDDLDTKVEELAESGLVFRSGPTDQRWLWREARIEDPDGNEICLYHAGEHRLNPPWRITSPEPTSQP